MQVHKQQEKQLERNFGNTGENELMNEEEFLIEMKNLKKKNAARKYKARRVENLKI